MSSHQLLFASFMAHRARPEPRLAMASAKREAIKTFGNRAAPWLWAPYIVEGADTFHLSVRREGVKSK